LLGQSMTLTQLLGGVLVVAGIALVRVDEFRSAEPAAASDHHELLLTSSSD
jgi:hypothetical protein